MNLCSSFSSPKHTQRTKERDTHTDRESQTHTHTMQVEQYILACFMNAALSALVCVCVCVINVRKPNTKANKRPKGNTQKISSSRHRSNV